MSKSMVLGLAVAVVGAIYFFKKKQAVTGGATASGSSAKNYQPAQPSQKYPFSSTVPPRVDNKNQPWYNGPTTAMQNIPGDPTNQGLAGNLKAGASIVNSLASVWGNLSNTFGGNDPKSNLTSTDSLPDDSSTDNSLSGSGQDQSNVVGQTYADAGSSADNSADASASSDGSSDVMSA